MATATATYERHRSYFNQGGQYSGFADTIGIYDNLSMAGTLAGAATSTYAAYAGSLPTQTVQRLPMGAESFRNVVGEARIAGRVAAGVGVIGIATDAAYFGHYLAEGDNAGALLSGGNVAYGIAGMALGGPVGLAFGGAQVAVNGGLYLYQRHQDSVDRRNTLQSAQASQDAMATAQRVGADIAAQMIEKGCK